MHNRYRQINMRYQKLLEKAKMEDSEGKILFFQYGGELSISSDLSNELSYRFPGKIIVVIYVTGVKANISVRGKKVRELILKTLEDLEDATGGGHEDAVGARIRFEDIEKFRDKLSELVG
jgi:nanoRNase/pAp phosphatase (c-di-AMP/oligoRNAs hydrolase)